MSESLDGLVTSTSTPMPVVSTGAGKKVKHPLYPRLLHLQHIHPNAWQRALLGEGALAIAVLLVLADLATSWTLLILPLAVAAVVKAHDVLAGMIGRLRVPGADDGDDG